MKRAALWLLVAILGLPALGREGLPADAPTEGLLITVDVSTNRLYAFRDGQLIRTSAAATGSDKILRSGGRIWWFRTPRGLHRVVGRIKDPVWTKPDWAFLEEGQRVPPPDSPKRLVRGKLGKYALDLGDGILLHGTDDPKSIGKKASHGCVRLPDATIAFLYREAAVGTPVYIFASQPEPKFASSTGLNDLEMTVD